MHCVTDNTRILEDALKASSRNAQQLHPEFGSTDWLTGVFRKRCIADVSSVMISPVENGAFLHLTLACELVVQTRDRQVLEKMWLPFYGSRNEVVIIAREALRIVIDNGGRHAEAANLWLGELAAFRNAEDTILVLTPRTQSIISA